MYSDTLHWLDWLVVATYLFIVIFLGWLFSRKQSDLKDYFVAKRNMNPILIGISLFATLLSTVSYLSKPGEIIKHGPMSFVGIVISLPIAYYVAGYWLIPAIMKKPVTSAYELLEQQLGLGVRLLGATIFITLRLVWMSLLIYIASEALIVVIGLDHSMLPIVSFITGAVAITYTSLGGLRAVVITDVMQFCLLLLGAILTITSITIRMGGFSWWPTGWADNWDSQPFFSLDPNIRVTVVGATLSNLIWYICTAGSDQTAIQRFMATRDPKAARKSYLITSFCTIGVSIVLIATGLALLGFYSVNKNLIPEGMSLVGNADQLFPLFISNQLPIGISGLVVSAMLAAAMSSVDSGVNSITAVVYTDFLRHDTAKALKRDKTLKGAKGISYLIGLIVVSLSGLLDYVPGNYFEMTAKTVNLFVSPLFGLFFMALFIPYATPLGAIVGLLYGFTTSFVVAFWPYFTGQPELSFHLISILGLSINLPLACAISKFGPKRGDRQNTRYWALGACLILAMILTLILKLAAV